MTPEDPSANTADAEPAGVADKSMRRRRQGGPKDIGPRSGAKSRESDEKEPSRGEETEQEEPRNAEQAGQHDQREAESEPEAEKVCGYPVHPAAALFPRCTDVELKALADDITKHGQLIDIVRHPDGSILDGLNRLRACEMAGRKPRIIKWEGKPGEEFEYVISQNIARRHLNESQRAIIASELTALRRGQRQTGKFAGLPTQAEAADMMHVSERTVRAANTVRKEAPANLTRLVKAGRLTVNAVSKLSTENRQRIEAMSDDDAEAEVKRLNKASAASPRRMQAASDQRG